MFEPLKDIIPPNSDVFVHSSMRSFGQSIHAETLIQKLSESVGKRGNILMPTFSFSFKETKLFDVENTPSKTGILPEVFRKKLPSIRSLNPMQSVSVLGPHAKSYTQMDCPTTFGENSLFDKFFKNDGMILLLGVDYNKVTFYHYLEEKYKVPYRYWKTFSGAVIGYDRKTVKTDYRMFVRKPEYLPNINHYGLLMEELGLVKKAVIGNCIIRLFKAKDLYDLLLKDLNVNKFCLVHTDRDIFKINVTV